MSCVLYIAVRHEVPLRVKRSFDILRSRFGTTFLRVFTSIKELDLTDTNKYLSAGFQDSRDKVKNVQSLEQLEEFLLDHTSFTDFIMLEGLAYNFGLEKVDEELVSYTEYRNKMYSEILAQDFEGARIDKCIKDSQTKVCAFLFVAVLHFID